MITDKPLKVLIVDDHDIVRNGLAMLISRHEDLLVATSVSVLHGQPATTWFALEFSDISVAYAIPRRFSSLSTLPTIRST